MIKFTCPRCKERHSVEDRLEGQVLACVCGLELTVPEAPADRNVEFVERLERAQQAADAEREANGESHYGSGFGMAFGLAMLFGANGILSGYPVFDPIVSFIVGSLGILIGAALVGDAAFRMAKARR